MERYNEVDTLRKNIIKVYEEDSSWDDAYSNFMEGNCVYFAMMLKVMYPEGKLMIEQGGGHVAVKIDNMIFDVCGMKLPHYFYEAEYEDCLNIETALLPLNKNERASRDKKYAMLINTVIDRYYPNMKDRKVLPEELEDYVFDDLLKAKKKVN